MRVKRVSRFFAHLLVFAMATSLLSPTYGGAGRATAKAKPKVAKVAYANVGKTLVLRKGGFFALKTTVTVSPNKAANKKLSFRSSKPKVVAVNAKGRVRAKAAKGNAKVTATSTVDKKRKATVRVRIGRPVTSITVKKTVTLLEDAGATSLKATVKPANATMKGVTWTSSNEAVASVDMEGRVMPIAVGNAKVTATATDGSGKKAVCNVVVQNHDGQPYAWRTTPALKELYQPNFLVGVGVGGSRLLTGQSSSFVRHHFNSVTMENEMKPDSLLDQRTSEQNAASGAQDAVGVRLDRLDAYLGYARDNNLKVRFHTLVWHQQTPEWFFCQNFDVGFPYVDAETMKSRLRSYITQIIDYTETKYPGVIYAWDVVNEALENSQSLYESIDGIQYRTNSDYTRSGKNALFQIVGRDYINFSFQYAKDALRKHGSGAKLFYNDFNTYMKTTTTIKLVEYINKDEKLCDGVGMQSHISINFPSLADYEGTLKRFINAGMEIHVTELDIGLYRHLDHEFDTQANLYGSLFAMYQKYPQVTSVTIWGINDGGGNWRASDAPLLLYNDYSPKKAFWSVLQR